MIGITNETEIGKIAMLAAMSSEEEEQAIKDEVAKLGNVSIAVTFISGMAGKVRGMYAKSIVGAALAGGVISKKSGHVHAVIHAGLEAFHGVLEPTTDANSVKVKVAVVSAPHWVAVAAYGHSAFSQYTNHERCGLGVMHI